MRRRVYLAGRIGTNLLMVGLALYLVYLIPPISFAGFSTGTGGSVLPSTYRTSSMTPLSPIRGVHIEARANDSFRTVILGIWYEDFFNWTNDWARINHGAPEGIGPNGPLYSGSHNYTALQSYIAQFPGNALLDINVTGGQQLAQDYYPPSETNATLAIANPTNRVLGVNFTLSYIGAVAPKGLTLLLSEIFIPVGIILTVPWLYGTMTERRKMKPTKS